MTFARFWMLNFLWLMPLAALVLVVYGRQRKKAIERLADLDLLARLTGKSRKGYPKRRGHNDPGGCFAKHVGGRC